MLIIDRPNTNPYFNIAAEEHLLKTLNEDCFMLWQNEPSIIIGKHQNTLAEINYQYVKENNVPVVRRISGGGTVFHDPGNLNFTFIAKGERDQLVDFKKYTKPIIGVLQSLGVGAKFEGKNDLRVNGLKISGNAEHVHRNKVLHHGTLLFSSDLHFLNEAIKVKSARFKDKAVQSVRSVVANITDFMDVPISIDEFREAIISHIKRSHKNVSTYQLTENDISSVNKLVKEKYNTWHWNFGYSPNYILETVLVAKEQKSDFSIHTKKGIIIKFSSDISSEPVKEFLNHKFIGLRHHFSEIHKKIDALELEIRQLGIEPKQLLDSFF